MISFIVIYLIFSVCHCLLFCDRNSGLNAKSLHFTVMYMYTVSLVSIVSSAFYYKYSILCSPRLIKIVKKQTNIF